MKLKIQTFDPGTVWVWTVWVHFIYRCFSVNICSAFHLRLGIFSVECCGSAVSVPDEQENSLPERAHILVEEENK